MEKDRKIVQFLKNSLRITKKLTGRKINQKKQNLLKKKNPKMITKTTTVKELRQDQHAKVYVSHIRVFEIFDKVLRNMEKVYMTIGEAQKNLPSCDYNFGLNNKGGETIVSVEYPDGGYFQSDAICSKKDCYNKKIGIDICMEQLAKQYAANDL